MASNTKSKSLPGTLQAMLDAYPLGEARRKAGLQAQELARVAGMTPSTYSQIETGKRIPTDDESKRLWAAIEDANNELGQAVQRVVKGAKSLSDSQVRQLAEIVGAHRVGQRS